MRTHIVIADDLVKAVDVLVGPRKRSQFFADAIEEKIKHQKRVELAKKLAGSLKNVDIPGWETSEKAAEWVSKNRKASDRNFPPIA